MVMRNVHEGHRNRLRERARLEGFDNFNPHQVLEYLLFYSIPRQDTSAIAHELIYQFGTIQAALAAPREELLKIKGIGPRTADWLGRIGELIDAYAELGLEDRPQITNYASALEFCVSRRPLAKIPSTYHVAMSPSGVVQVFEPLCDSLQWCSAIPLRKSMFSAMAVHARNVIVIEYVKQETPKVRAYDKRAATSYAGVLRCTGSELLDVILVGSRDAISMNREGSFDRELYGEARSRLSERYLLEPDSAIDYGLPYSDEGL